MYVYICTCNHIMVVHLYMCTLNIFKGHHFFDNLYAKLAISKCPLLGGCSCSLLSIYNTFTFTCNNVPFQKCIKVLNFLLVKNSCFIYF